MTVIGVILAVIAVFVIPVAIVVGIPYAAENIFYDNLITMISWVLALSLGIGWIFGLEIMVSKYNWNDGSCRVCNEQLHLVGGARYGYVYSCDNDHPVTIYANPNNL